MNGTRSFAAWSALSVLLGIACHSGPRSNFEVEIRNGPCEGYACTAEGARVMFDDLATERLSEGERTLRARSQLNRLFDDAVDKMEAEKQLTPEGFKIASENFDRLVNGIGHGLTDPVPRAVQKVREGISWLCPLWPFC